MNNSIFIPFKDKNLLLAVGITSLIVAIVYFTSPVDISNKLAPGWALVTMIVSTSNSNFVPSLSVSSTC